MIRILLGVLMGLLAVGAASAQNEYEIMPGDVLQIEVLEDPSLNRNALVLPDGQVPFPLAGTVQAGGRSIDQFQVALEEALAPNFATEPTVFVSIARLAAPGPEAAAPEADLIDVYAIGEFANPGKFEIEPGTTLLQFLAASGGFTQFAATKRIQLRRTDPSTGREHIYRFNYRAVERGGRIIGQSTLMPGDVVVAPERRLFE